ncbi:3-hydroxyisobutyrate dehydrogenase-like beta-hydroxyacid dehydrogenase [Angulomicrobium tetraedrale]|uniref:3-hydroxyisobutyrate dehydrogenase-like beta-hydroxyacid dehydrogenase n=1 Tax=Ancylobacter tetraedralis TaxID=217068 RepID=A0A839Z503_9HYPH|nr:NAD(P)-dependent oxidoreductase [Ancylobacter tetraedralis]MBB3770021.1 3-hydroxyisobutyrate dehydrogenase-like beta-hydroxyacid dehydrogenase [Ancylobacter tetraedralis]
MTHAPLKIGIIGFGEVGSSFTRGLLDGGGVDIVAYDDPPGPTERALALRRAAELDVRLAFEPSILGDRDIVLSSVTQDAAAVAARASIPALLPSVIYADVNSLGPSVKAEVAGIVTATGRAFVDIAIMGAPASGLHRVPLLAAGGPASELAARLAPFGFDIRVVGDRPGQAAAVKILRSVLTKGLETLLVESLVAARRYGLDGEVIDSFVEMFERKGARDVIDFLLRSHGVHAGRRALEVAQSADTIAQVGLDPVVSRVVSARLAGLADLGLKRSLGGEQPATLALAIAHLDAALGHTASQETLLHVRHD